MWGEGSGGGAGGIRRIAGGAGTGRAARTGRPSGGGGFHLAEPLAAGAGAAAGPAIGTQAAAPAGVALLALQERGAESERDTRAHRRGGAMLDELRALQADLLRGAADLARLARLARLAEGETGADPGLREAVAGIALRVRVELARLGLAASPSRN